MNLYLSSIFEVGKVTGNFNSFVKSVGTKEGLIATGIAIVACILLIVVARNSKKSLSTTAVVAIGIGAALYAALSAISLPIGPNTSFRFAIALLPIFGAIFGPVVGFLVGFIGHALNDAFMYGSVWWSWVFLSAVLGLFGGLITLDSSFNVLSGKIKNAHIIKMYVYAVIGMVVASIVAYAGDVFLYGEPANKVYLQIILAASSNLAVMALVGIPVIILIAKLKEKSTNLELE